MKVTAAAFWTFVLVVAGTLLLLMAVPDVRTGRTAVSPRRLAESTVARARASGDAATALWLLRSLPPEALVHAGVQDVLPLLAAELAPVRVRDGGRELPSLTALQAMTSAELVCALQDRIGDRALAAVLEPWFEPDGPRTRTGIAPGIDAAANELLASLTAKGGARIDGEIAAARLLDLAARFATAGRARAAHRFRLRAMAVAPDALAPRLELARELIAGGRLVEALAVVSPRRVVCADEPLAREHWRTRADLARWRGELAIEAEALEMLVAFVQDPADETRLIEVLLALPDPVRALRHCIRAAERSGRPDAMLAAGELALRVGETDTGLSLLQQVGPSPERRVALRLRAQVLAADLRYDMAIQGWREVLADGGTEQDEIALAALCRRASRHDQLAALLLQRFERHPDDAALGRELLHLLVGLGRDDDAQRVVRLLAANVGEPREFFRLLPLFVRSGERGFAARAVVMARDPRLLADDLPAVFWSLEALMPQLPLPDVVLALAHRFAGTAALHRGLVLLVDALPDAGARADVARALAELEPGDDLLLRAWIERAEWASRSEDAVRARQRWCLLHPDDRGNRARLATLLLAHGDPDRALRALDPSDQGARPASLPEAAAALARYPGAAVDDWRQAADRLLARNQPAAALPLLDAILEQQADDPAALLHSAQALAWSGQPGAAIPRFERRLRVSDRDVADVRFQLAEALSAAGQPAAARQQYERARIAYELQREPTFAARQNHAMALHRTLRHAQAAAALRALLHERPDDPGLHVKLADVLLADNRLDEAGEALLAAQALAPGHRDVLRLDSRLQAARGQFAAARAPLEQALQQHADDPGLHAELGYLHERAGDVERAVHSYRRWLALQPGDAAAAATQFTTDRTGTLVGAQFDWRQVGDDKATEVGIVGAVPLGERWRAHARVGYGDYRGRAQAVAAGTEDVTASTPLLDLALAWRYGGDDDQVGAGILWTPDAPGGHDVGAWLMAHWNTPEPFQRLELRLHVDEPWTNPTAAFGLSGRTNGAELRGYQALGERGFLAGYGSYRRLRIVAPDGSHPDDDEVVADLSAGFACIRGALAVADWFRPRHAPPGPLSPYLGKQPVDDGDLQLSVWAGYRPTRLRGDAELSRLLPLSPRTDLLYVAARADRQFARHFGMKLEGFVGRELQADVDSFGVDVGATWRPEPQIECSVGGGVGRDINRGGFDGDSLRLHFEVLIRW